MASTAKKKDKNRELITLPDNFNLEQHLIQYPPVKNGFYSTLKFNKDKAYYFLGLITSIASRSSDLVTHDGYTPIYQKKVRDSIKDIKLYIDYLINTGVIVCNNTYTVGKKSLGYKWSQQYTLCKFTTKKIECKYENFDSNQYANQHRDYPYLFHWYQENKLMIDVIAEDYAFQLYQKKMNDPTKKSWDLDNKGKPKDPESQYKNAIHNIAKIKYHSYEAHLDEAANRLHSAFTGLGKIYRKYVTYDGEKLIGIDIKNCQPYMACLILNKDFWSPNSSLPLNIKSLPLAMQAYMMNPPDHPSMFKYLSDINVNDFKDYINVASSGLFYENVIDLIEKKLDKKLTREEAKKLMFYTIYSRNKLPKDPYLKQVREIFKEVFPQISVFFKFIKHEFEIFKDIELIGDKQHNRLALLLQNIESTIILHRCCKRIWDEGKQQVPIFTIHDSIVTTVKHKKYVKDIMTEELKKLIGIQPALSVEEWK